MSHGIRRPSCARHWRPRSGKLPACRCRGADLRISSMRSHIEAGMRCRMLLEVIVLGGRPRSIDQHIARGAAGNRGHRRAGARIQGKARQAAHHVVGRGRVWHRSEESWPDRPRFPLLRSWASAGPMKSQAPRNIAFFPRIDPSSLHSRIACTTLYLPHNMVLVRSIQGRREIRRVEFQTEVSDADLWESGSCSGSFSPARASARDWDGFTPSEPSLKQPGHWEWTLMAATALASPCLPPCSICAAALPVS